MKDGGPAFPVDVNDNGGGHTNEGMSLRDWLAGQALTGMCQGCGWQGGDFESMTRHAYAAADAMLKARGLPS